MEDDDDYQTESEFTEIPGNWDTVRDALNLQEMEFDDFLVFDDNIAACGELSDQDIISSVVLASVPNEDEKEDDKEEEVV